MNLFTILHILFSKGVKKSFSRTFSLLLVGLLATTITQAADITHNINTQGVLTIPGNTTNNYIVIGTGAVTTNNIIINEEYKGTVTLRNVNITRTSGASCINVIGKNNLSNNTPTTIVDIVLDGTNRLTYTGGGFCAFQVNQGAQINIRAIDPTNNSSGILEAKSTNKTPGASSGTNEGGAGIGAPTSQGAQGTSTIYNPNGTIYQTGRPTAGGNIIISSGTITAWGGHGAGIGGGYGTYYNGLIIIYGGKIEARAARHAAGIGSGCPNGYGVQQYFADMSTVVAVPPAEIECYGTESGNDQQSGLGLTGTRRITYINDPNKPVITVRTIDDEPDANIYLDLTETPDLESIFQIAGINKIAEIRYDLKKVRVGRTNASGIMTFNGRFEQNTTFFTDASSSKPENLGRPYLPVKKIVMAAETIILPLLDMKISLTDTQSTPLDVGYTAVQAKQKAYRLKIEYNDPNPMTGANFSLQGGGANFTGITFHDSNYTNVLPTPTTLSQGQTYYLMIPIVQNKPIGIYSDVLLIKGTWKTQPLQAPIRKVVTQRVAFDDTNTHTYIKMTASEKKFTVEHPTNKTITLNLNINHGGLSVPYDQNDVTAKYLITTEANYDAALTASGWTNMNIPTVENTNTATTVSFSGRSQGTYYIHWQVESGVVYAHSKNVTNPADDYGGYGPYKIVPPLQVGTIVASNPYVCFGKAPDEIKGTLPLGGSGDFSYQWEISPNNSSWTPISGANTQNYKPTVALTVSPTYFRRIDTDNQLVISTPTASVKIEQYAELKGGTIGSNQNICYNTAPALLTSTTSGSGGDGNIIYEWQSSANGTTWTNITSNGTSATYQPAALTTTTHYRREVKDGASCGTEYSNIITITVNPIATVNPITDQTVCNGTAMPAITFGTPITPANKVTYSWTNDQPSIGIAATGTTSAIPTFTATNNGTSAIVATITVTPKYDNSCTGTPLTFKITVNPTAKVNAIADQTVCNGTSMSAITFGTTATPSSKVTYTWTNNTASIGLVASGSGNLPAFTATNNGTAAVTANITVTPKYENCTGTPLTFKITVNPTAKVNAIADQTVCNGTSMSAITFGTTATPSSKVTYTWTNNTASIGLAASGSGNLPAFTATNNGTAAVTANITVTPKYENCTGTPLTFKITVNPTAKVNAIADQTVCNGTSMSAITFGTTATPSSKVTYTWTNNTASIGLAASGSGNLPAFTATNNGTAAVTANITVTPKYENCTGTPLTFKITVNPTAKVNAIADQTVCNGIAMPAITFGTPITPANKVTYSWANDQPGIGIAATGTTSAIPTFTATNNGTSAIIATITVTPKYENCTGTPLTFKITVNPTAKVNAIADQTVCNGTAMPAITFGTPITPANKVTYSWANDQPGIGIAATGTTSAIPTFTATNNGTSVIVATITVTPKYDNSCTGTPLTFKITVHPQVVPGTIKGNPFVCQNIIPLPIQGDVSTGGSNAANIKYKWQSSANGTSGWTYITGAVNKDYTPTSPLASNTYFRRVTTDNFCNTFEHYSNIFLIKVVSLPTTLYWKTSADADNNWNNPNNWVDGAGIQLGMVPLACTDVVIRGGAAKYPSLDASTITNIYGDPVCQNITFEYGAEVAYQHKLAYEKAFVQYNWGYYTGTPGNNSQPNNNGSGASCSVNKRDVWHALAAPLKNMASGDFSFGGYPMTWQGGFNISDPVTGGTVGVDAGDFSKVYARNDIDLTETNNAIAIKIPTFQTGKIGCEDQCHMDGVKGVLEFPYFENENKAQFYPTHSYDKYSLESKFFYFDTKTLQLIYSPVGRMKRGKESYRFIYENASNTAGKINLNGTEVLGYEQSVSKQLASSQKVMVGNPFMASINSKRFLDANNINPASLKIKENEGYYIFNATTQTWENKPFSATNNIKAQQAFLVTLADGISTTKLMYPLEGTYALTGPTFRGFSMVLPEGSSLYLKASSGIEKAGDYSILNINESEEQYNIRKMIYTEGHIVPETFFIAADGNDFNLIQAYESGVREVGIGVKCSDTEGMISFTFENADEFYSATGACPVLIDKVTNVRQNLTKDKSYYFKQRAVDVKDKYIDAERFVLRLASPVEIMNSENSDISIVYHQGILDISATDVIKEVLVYDIQGRLVHSNTKVGTISYSKSLNLSQGVYVVKVQTENGKTKVERVMAL